MYNDQDPYRSHGMCVVLMSGTALSQTTAPAPAETPAPLTVSNKELFKPAPGTSPAAPEGSRFEESPAESIGKLNDLANEAAVRSASSRFPTTPVKAKG
ncbi:hypothetical protein LJR231_005295 [Phyllobacterium sp. LjRoot231]|uniref:hypothetical protein n=1 Tax=Phyllobacterium sp. LjRoot231 TaxID=3342289 RepID=UPI003ECF7B24